MYNLFYYYEGIEQMIQKVGHTKIKREAAWVDLVRAFFSRIFSNYSLPTWAVLMLDLGAVFISFVFSFLLRFNFEPSAIDFPMAFSQSIIVICVYGGFELLFKSNANLIRHSTINDIFNVVLTTTSSMLILIVLALINRLSGYAEILAIPLSIILIHYVSISVLLFMIRILIKLFYELSNANSYNKKNVIIYGAGVMGTLVKRVILMDQDNEYNVVAFIDQSRKLQNKKLDGIPVFSPRKLRKDFMAKMEVEIMIFAVSNISNEEKKEIYKLGVDIGLEVLKLPPVSKWLHGKFKATQLRKVRVQDLLSREPIQMDLEKMENELSGKIIMVTGAAGSIGSELVRQLVNFDIGELILVDNAETPMFHLDKELARLPVYRRTVLRLADVCDQLNMDKIFKKHQPQIVFHAAAYKHVPLLESNPHESLRVNVGSAFALTELSRKYKIQKFIMVSTDKAVNPTNVMGASKRMCELIVQARSIEDGNCTSYITTRFGNVLGSNGSVIPLFQKQIDEGGPVTVTHPEVSRYFMTIPEAAQLVLEAGFMGLGGEIFVFNMGEQVKIIDLARRMIKLSGFKPDVDIDISFTGLRPGEKLYEELLNIEEKTLPTYHPKVRSAEGGNLKGTIDLLDRIKNLLNSHLSLKDTRLIERIIEIVPEYNPSNERFMRKSGDSEAIDMKLFPD